MQNKTFQEIFKEAYEAHLEQALKDYYNSPFMIDSQKKEQWRLLQEKKRGTKLGKIFCYEK